MIRMILLTALSLCSPLAAAAECPGNPDALAMAIGRMLDDRELRDRLGAAGRERVLGKFTWRRTAEGMLDNWYAMLDARGAQA